MIRLSGPPDSDGGSRVDAASLRARARKVLREVGESRSELSLSLVDDREMTEINREYRGIARPTDVLSFSLVEGEGAEHRGRLLGDVVIGVDTARRQARERHRSLDHELTRLLIHGVLHLLGHDHEEDADAKEMRAEERRIWRSLKD
jgi:probable rRNA maturation factor